MIGACPVELGERRGNRLGRLGPGGRPGSGGQFGERDGIGALLNENFDVRSEMYDVGEGNRRMVAAARSVGASAKFTGSGGAIIGTYGDDAMFEALEKVYDAGYILGELKRAAGQ